MELKNRVINQNGSNNFGKTGAVPGQQIVGMRQPFLEMERNMKIK